MKIPRWPAAIAAAIIADLLVSAPAIVADNASQLALRLADSFIGTPIALVILGLTLYAALKIAGAPAELAPVIRAFLGASSARIVIVPFEIALLWAMRETTNFDTRYLLAKTWIALHGLGWLAVLVVFGAALATKLETSKPLAFTIALSPAWVLLAWASIGA